MSTRPDPALPVTVVISRRAAPGREGDLHTWAEGIIAAADAFPGHLGGQIYPPAPPDRDDFILAFSFASARELSDWEASAQRRRWLARADGLIVGPATTHAVSGFEGIFARSHGEAVVPPARWKTATIIALALYPASLVLSWLLVPRLGDLNVAVRVLVTTAILVPYMAWVGVPALTRLLRGWLRR